MQKLMLRFSPLFFFLLIFSCAKDQELIPLAPNAQRQEVKQNREKETCDIPCRKPDYLTINNVTGCAASIQWGFDKQICGTFLLQLQNLLTGEINYISPTSNPFTLTDLDPCTEYTIGVSHVTDQCSSIPLKMSFQTDCKGCKECNIKCKDPDFAFVENIGLNSASVNFGFNNSTCGYFSARLKNNATGEYTYFDPATSPLNLTDLDPCTSYTIGISHVTKLCSRLPTKLDFTTNCEVYCESSGTDTECLYNMFLRLNSYDPDDVIWTSNPSLAYIDATDEVLEFTPGEQMNTSLSGACWCHDLEGNIYMKLWIDYNQDYTFDNDEQVYDYALEWPGSDDPTVGCYDFSILTNYTFPNISACGMRARYILTQEEDAGPCGTISSGQVIDFTVNSDEGC